MRKQLKSYEQLLRRHLTNLRWRISGHTAYRRFVIICHQRTGSNLLVSLLDAHPDIECHGELFRLLGGRSVRQIDRLYFNAKPKTIRAAGFKMFYDHPHDGDPAELLKRVDEMDRPLIIHLTRDDTIRALVSLKIAQQTGVWFVRLTDEKPTSAEKKITLTKEEIEVFFKKVKEQRAHIQDHFQQADYLHITYEAFVQDPASCVKQIFERLEVRDVPVTPRHQKINPEPLEELIVNYAQLREQGVI